LALNRCFQVCLPNKHQTIFLSKEFFNGADIAIEVKAKVIYESDTKDIITGRIESDNNLIL